MLVSIRRGAVLNEAVVEILKKKVKNERISCKAAHEAGFIGQGEPCRNRAYTRYS